VKLLGQARAVMAAALIAAALVATCATWAVAAPPRAAQNPQYQVPLPYLTPIPVVRLSGRLTRTGARITLLRVSAPRSASVTVRCAGGRRKGCAFRSKTKTSPRSRTVRFREIERRLKAGVRLRIYVTKGNTVGKYASFVIRKKRFPRRVDSCLFPGDPFEPRSCP
jgi:hypothetical protein